MLKSLTPKAADVLGIVLGIICALSILVMISDSYERMSMAYYATVGSKESLSGVLGPGADYRLGPIGYLHIGGICVSKRF